jgi:hypothetical protein
MTRDYSLVQNVQTGLVVSSASHALSTYPGGKAGLRGEFRPRQTRQLPRAVDLKGWFLFLVVENVKEKLHFKFYY